MTSLRQGAQQISPEAVSAFMRAVAEGKDAAEITRMLLDLVTGKGGGGGRDLSSFDKIDDDLLARSIANPTTGPMR